MSVTIHTSKMPHFEHEADLCIVGGGLSGVCAALAAARRGVKVCLMQDRPVLGGNSSSEIRMWVRGAKGLHNRENGIISELEEENIYVNSTLMAQGWDAVIWGKVKENKNIELILNCSCVDADTDEGGRITAVKGWQLTTYSWHTVRAKYFADCSGDSILAPIVGAHYRVGREGHDEYGEQIGPIKADRKTMGMSCLIQARETDHPVKFTPPEWAYKYENDYDFEGGFKKDMKIELDADFSQIVGSISDRDINRVTACARVHTLGTSDTNFWWLELGGEFDSIADTEMLRDELLKISFGIWDHVKNHGDHGADNWELEWVGFLPGKRESRRYVGRHVLTQSDVEGGGRFDDIVAFGGWPMDDHNPAGFYSFRSTQPPSLLYPAPSPYGIPYRCLYSDVVPNLFFAGRNISATHAANSSTRVMATCSLLGEAMGTAASICINEGLTPDEVYEKRREELKDSLRDGGCYIPYSARRIPELSLGASVSLSEGDRELLFNGLERPDGEGTVNYVTLPVGGEITYDLREATELSELRIMFDPDFSRKSVSPNKKMRVFAQKCMHGADFVPVSVPNTLVKSFKVIADRREIFSSDKYHNALFRLPLNISAKTVTVRFLETWGADSVHIFSCDLK